MNIEGKMFPYVEHMLDWAAKRQQTISANLANIDTPGYKAKDISFSDHMQSIELETSSPAHLKSVVSNGMNVYELDAEAKDNGNTVDLDHQMTDLTKNGL